LIVDDQPILTQALSYLQASGKLQPFILEILRRNILEQEVQTEMILTLVLRNEQAVIDFRLEQLTDPKIFGVAVMG